LLSYILFTIYGVVMNRWLIILHEKVWVALDKRKIKTTTRKEWDSCKTDGQLIVTHGRGRGATLRIQCAVFGFNTCSFLDLVCELPHFWYYL
jgi:hypothetical protein